MAPEDTPEIARWQNGWEKCVSFCNRHVKNTTFGKIGGRFTYYLKMLKNELQFGPLWVQPKLALKFSFFLLFKKNVKVASFLQF